MGKRQDDLLGSKPREALLGSKPREALLVGLIPRNTNTFEQGVCMPIVIQCASTYANQSCIFNFNDDVQTYVVGVSYWSFSYNGEDNHVRQLALNLSNSQPNSRQIVTTAIATLSDDSGNTIYNPNSLVNLTCIAVTKALDSNITLTSVTGVQSGSSSEVQLPGSTLSIASAFANGWSFTQPRDHHVETVQFAAGFMQSGNMGQVTSQAQMFDDTGHYATCSIDGGLVAANPSERGLLVQSLPNQQTSSQQWVDFNVPLSSGGVLITSYTVTYGSRDHHVETIGGGCSSTWVNGSLVFLQNAQAFMWDDSGNSEDDSSSNVSLLVFGVPA